VITPFVRILLVANGLIYVAMWQLDWADRIAEWFALWPYPQVLPWQLVTYGFLHGGFTHLFFNMFALWMFGRRIEAYWGTKRFVIYYFVCVIGAALVNLFVLALQGRPSLTLGASGGVFGILLAYGMMFPNNRVVLLIPPIPMKAKWFVILYGVLELSFGVAGIGPSIAHFAHLGGMLFGFLLIQYWRRRWPFGFRSRTK
jgi:membrane associated rhomboid family serine protease